MPCKAAAVPGRHQVGAALPEQRQISLSMKPSGQHQCQVLEEDHWMGCEPPVGVEVQENCSSMPWEALQKPCTYGNQSKYFQQLGAARTWVI